MTLDDHIEDIRSARDLRELSEALIAAFEDGFESELRDRGVIPVALSGPRPKGAELKGCYAWTDNFVCPVGRTSPAALRARSRWPSCGGTPGASGSRGGRTWGRRSQEAPRLGDLAPPALAAQAAAPAGVAPAFIPRHMAPAFRSSLLIACLTVSGCQRPPRGVLTWRFSSSRAMPRKEVTPARWMSSMCGLYAEVLWTSDKPDQRGHVPPEAFALHDKAPLDEAAFIAGWAKVPLETAAAHIAERKARNAGLPMTKAERLWVKTGRGTPPWMRPGRRTRPPAPG